MASSNSWGLPAQSTATTEPRATALKMPMLHFVKDVGDFHRAMMELEERALEQVETSSTERSSAGSGNDTGDTSAGQQWSAGSSSASSLPSMYAKPAGQQTHPFIPATCGLVLARAEASAVRTSTTTNPTPRMITSHAVDELSSLDVDLASPWVMGDVSVKRLGQAGDVAVVSYRLYASKPPTEQGRVDDYVALVQSTWERVYGQGTRKVWHMAQQVHIELIDTDDSWSGRPVQDTSSTKGEPASLNDGSGAFGHGEPDASAVSTQNTEGW